MTQWSSSDSVGREFGLAKDAQGIARYQSNGGSLNCVEPRSTECDNLDNGQSLAKEKKDMETPTIVALLIVPTH